MWQTISSNICLAMPERKYNSLFSSFVTILISTSLFLLSTSNPSKWHVPLPLPLHYPCSTFHCLHRFTYTEFCWSFVYQSVHTIQALELLLFLNFIYLISRSFLFSLLPFFWENESRIKPSLSYLSISVSLDPRKLLNAWTDLMKLGMHIMASQFISVAYFINPPH